MSTLTDLWLGPLTTTFTAPPECNSITVSPTTSSSFLPYVYPRLFSSIAKSCFPSGYPLGSAALSSTYGKYGYHDEHVYFSPGICPSGWLMNTVGAMDTETTAFCCEPGFNPQTSPAVLGGPDSTLCTSTIISTEVTTVAYTGDGEVNGFSRTFTFQDVNIPAPAIWIRFKDTDFSTTAETRNAVTTSSTSSTLSDSSTSSRSSSLSLSKTNTADAHTILSTGNPSSTPERSSTPRGKSLSTGAKIGLGLGIPLWIFLLSGLFAFVFIRKRKRGGTKRLSELPAGDVEINTIVGRSELDSNGMSPPLSGLDVGGQPVTHGIQTHELPG